MNRIGVCVIAAGILAAESRGATQAAPEQGLFEGSLSAVLVRGGALQTNRLLFTRKANLLRIRNAEQSPTGPVNLVELDSGRMTLVFPQSSTFMRLEPEKNAPPAVPGLMSPPALPTQGAFARGPMPSLGPTPGFPVPAQLPSGVGPQWTSNPPSAQPPIPAGPGQTSVGLPARAAMPFPMPQIPMNGGTVVLQKCATNRTILGLTCALYTLTNRFEALEVWAVPDAELFPLRLLERDPVRRHFGPQRLEEQWVELLRRHSVFPLEATLRVGQGIERLSFKVTAIQKKKIGPEGDSLFAVPPGFQQIEPPTSPIVDGVNPEWRLVKSTEIRGS